MNVTEFVPVVGGPARSYTSIPDHGATVDRKGKKLYKPVLVIGLYWAKDQPSCDLVTKRSV